MIRRAALLAALALALAAAGPAEAYVRATAQQNQLPSFWNAGCEIVTIYINGFTGMSTDEIAKSIAAAAHAWSPEMVTCPGISDAGGAGHPSFEIITQLAFGEPPPGVALDARNAIVFRTDTWEPSYADAIAVTSRHTDPSGRIFDADIEINATTSIDFAWANLDPGSPPPHAGTYQIDLQTAITHEFGHFLGLAHTCYNEGHDPPPRPVDDQGRPSPPCVDGIPEQAAVMWYQVDRGLTNKRVITTDDARGVCAIYPPNVAVAACAANLPEDGCGCRTGGGGGASGAALIVLGVLAARRRRS